MNEHRTRTNELRAFFGGPSFIAPAEAPLPTRETIATAWDAIGYVSGDGIDFDSPTSGEEMAETWDALNDVFRQTFTAKIVAASQAAYDLLTGTRYGVRKTRRPGQSHWLVEVSRWDEMAERRYYETLSVHHSQPAATHWLDVALGRIPKERDR